MYAYEQKRYKSSDGAYIWVMIILREAQNLIDCTPWTRTKTHCASWSSISTSQTCLRSSHAITCTMWRPFGQRLSSKCWATCQARTTWFISKRGRREADASASAHPTKNSDSDPSNSNSQSSHSTSNSEVSEDEEQPKLKLKWCKPGALSRRVGVSLGIMRNWAKANLVRTIVSPGGHRLFHVQSVLQHIEQAKASSSKSRRKKLQASNSANTKFQLVAYVCVDTSNRNRAQLEAVGEQIKNQVIQHYEISEDNCSIVVELQTDAKRPEQLLTDKTIQVTDTPGIRLLLTKISSRSCSKVVLRRTEDISSAPSTYAFFLLLCQKGLHISVEIVPELFRHTS